jgi:RNA polymerase sigma factor (sigma-70 family)
MEAAGSHAPFTVDHAYPRSRSLLRLASDERLVQRVRAGSEQAFAVLYERHYRKLLSFCRHMLGSPEEAEDAVQQSFVNAYRDMLRDDKELNFRPWLYRIARNQCITTLRGRRVAVEHLESEPSTVGLAQVVADRDELRGLLQDLARLPDDQREALVLAELHDNSHSEVAEILACDREKVKSLVFQARNSLIKSREARETPCEEIRAQISVLSGGALRRNVIRRHLAQCEGCRSWRKAVKSQRRAMAILLPVIPSSALKFGAANAVAAAGVAGAASQGSAAGGALSGSLTTLAGKLGVPAVVMKGVATAATVAVVAAGGTVAVKEVDDQLGSSQTTRAVETSPPGPRSAGGAQRGIGSSAAGAAAALERLRAHGQGNNAIGRRRRGLAQARRHRLDALPQARRHAGKRGHGPQGSHPLSRRRSGGDPKAGRDRTSRPIAGHEPHGTSPRSPKIPLDQTISPDEEPLLGTTDTAPTP